MSATFIISALFLAVIITGALLLIALGIAGLFYLFLFFCWLFEGNAFPPRTMP